MGALHREWGAVMGTGGEVGVSLSGIGVGWERREAIEIGREGQLAPGWEASTGSSHLAPGLVAPSPGLITLVPTWSLAQSQVL